MAHEMYMRDDGILSIALEGDMDQDEAKSFSTDLQPFLASASDENPLYVLARRKAPGRYRPAARKVFSELNSYPQLSKVAIVNPSRYGRVLIGFIVKASGRDNVRFFPTEDEALAWLNAGRM